MCKGPEVRAVPETFCKTARRGLCGQSREGDVHCGGGVREGWGGPVRGQHRRPCENSAFTLCPETAKHLYEGPVVNIEGSASCPGSVGLVSTAVLAWKQYRHCVGERARQCASGFTVG